MDTTRKRLAMSFHAQGKFDHPYVIEFAKQLNVKEEDVAKVRDQKVQTKEALKKISQEITKKKAAADRAEASAKKARAEAEAAAQDLPRFEEGK